MLAKGELRHICAIWGKLRAKLYLPPNDYVEVLTLSTLQCDCV